MYVSDLGGRGKYDAAGPCVSGGLMLVKLYLRYARPEACDERKAFFGCDLQR